MITFDVRKIAYIDSVLGTPYKPGADGPEAYDCLGISREALKLYEVELPWVERPQDVEIAQKTISWALHRHPDRVHWKTVEKPFDGALVMMGNVLRNTWHLGVYMVVGRQHLILHTTHEEGVLCDDILTLGAKGYNQLTYRRKISNGPHRPQRDPLSGG